MVDSIRFRRNIEGSLTSIVLKLGEPSYDFDEKGVRIGDGHTVYTNLPLFVTTATIDELVVEALRTGGSAVIADLIAELTDDGSPDGNVDGDYLDVLYENRKV